MGPLAIQRRIARRRVKVCAATRLDLDAPSTVRHWDDNGAHTHILSDAAFDLRRSHMPKALCADMREQYCNPEKAHDASLMRPPKACAPYGLDTRGRCIRLCLCSLQEKHTP